VMTATTVVTVVVGAIRSEFIEQREFVTDELGLKDRSSRLGIRM
jgi:hypothetical protein